ncbi:proline dehydrogenase family protein [Saccharomonospora sp. NPDC006951]
MLRAAIIAASRSPRCRALVEGFPPVRPIVERFVAGTTVSDALRVTSRLADDRYVTLDHLGENTGSREQAAETASAYQAALHAIAGEGLAGRAEVSVKLSSLGLTLPVDGPKIALDNTRAICAAAEAAGTTVTVDMEDHTTTDQTLTIVNQLRVDYPRTGTVLQAYLRRTEADCAALAGPHSRVRLCKGAYAEPAAVAYQRKSDVDASYVRFLKLLIGGEGYPMIATHDPRLIAIAETLVAQAGRPRDSYEFQFLYGIRLSEQRRLAAEGHRVRVYVPYGSEWYPYFVRRIGERPANLAFFARALAGG